MDEEELELKEKLREEKKAILEERKRKRLDPDRKHTKADNVNNNNRNSGKAIYISNLPLQEDEGKLRDQLIQEFNKFGDLERDQDNKLKCKMYKDNQGKLKGDAIMIYCRKEYALLAVEMMDGINFEGYTIKVEPAQFTEKNARKQNQPNEDIASDYSTKTPTTGNKESRNMEHDLKVMEGPVKRRKMDENNDSRRERTLVLANFIDIYKDLDSPEIQEIEQDLLDGCRPFGKIGSHVMNVDKGEIHITFMERQEAISCRNAMNGRFFDGRQLVTFMLDEEDLSNAESETTATSSSSEEEDNGDFIDDI